MGIYYGRGVLIKAVYLLHFSINDMTVSRQQYYSGIILIRLTVRPVISEIE